jgi:RNA polymerase sigma factor (sigma-70 family)
MAEPGVLTQLLEAAASGDSAAWDALVARFASLLWGVARSFRLDQEDAADVVQNTWLKLLDHLRDIKEPEALAGWLATTARYESLSVLRRKGREQVVRDDDLAERVTDAGSLDLDAVLLSDERDAHLWRCFARLSEPCQRLLRVLMATDRPHYAAVSEALGMPIGSIGPNRMRCLDKLRALLGRSDYDFEGGETR